MRVQGKGLNANGAPLTFTFDGQEYQGREGDTLAAALLANGQRLVGRSFKYHRPRGVLSAGSEEPNALVTIGKGAGQDPNIRATTQELYDGLEARSQNAWPSLKNDVMAVNDLMSPFLSAGFYYKTFMWPKAFWEKVYEPIIRRAAGLGALSGETNEDTYEKAFAHCDVLVIGAGPAGIMAALTAARAGLDVILADEDSRMGGRLLAETYDVDGQAGADWAAEQIAALNAMENVRLMPRTTVTGAYDQGTYSALERVGHHRADRTGPRECFWRIVAKRSILCAGALERPIAFPNNDRPGIMTAGAVRSYLNRWGVAPGQAVTVFANNDDAHRTALDFIDAGVTVAGVIDSRDSAHALGDYPLLKGGQVIATKGRHGLTSITVQHAGGTEEIATDCLAMSGGWNPAVHLTCHMNGRPTWSDDILSFVPTEGSVPNMSVAGAANGVFSTLGCLQDGIDTAQGILADLGVNSTDVETPSADDTPYRIEPLWQVEGKGRKWLDFQNDVTVKDIRLAALENFRSVEHMKRYTTQGMATDQGKNSNVAALAVLADATGRGIPETGTTTFRPPYSPVAIAAMGAGSQGHGFAPERLMTSHHATTSRGAPMIEAGLWYRPSYFPRSGEETWLESCNREVAMVRGAVGICDVSTLGKIDIQGPDAAAFLDFVYCNTFSTLKENRVRYGLMLREDGHVMDDGTTARLGPNHYVMTTTTAAAGQVMRHLDWVSQALRPDLDVRFASVTEQWAQFAVAGLKSRDLLNTILDDEIDNDSWPFMACGSVGISGVQGRLFRISFSGEHAYEIAVPSRYGASLFGQLTAQAEAMGGGAYGMEALNVMRIEKGFITHAEIHGRTTAFDIGFDRMVSQKKDCIGNAASRREGLLDSQREQLVGLKPVEADGKLTSGAHLFVEGADAVRLNSQGYVTSVCFSPTLGHDLGLAFIKDGPNRYGEHVMLVDHLRDVRTLCEVCHPGFFDPEGGLARG
ncbi:sarcosine oxidase subunit alpha family protein [Octadecabacter sp. 1_MG-2023]|uniref:sarcosine oxidase subunit alpha family protein n=1 Tax=unclassified Octadecabacter TaxID=196158 RepID=UPI001C07FA5A|nr:MULTISPECIES: sarcosine oxidase subunit alpha family protein [unclassified Octadecabacter]MBU2993926.1 sarcosine oxidase subunit alpha family protein [Octadecabacter sp. B2R22]MDO6735228.1 sarcosine oxidase subunit alpha family protein [Octadecabacter sp. 1_MG-2023]